MQNFISNAKGAMGGAGGPDDGVPWWMKYAGKGTGVVSGVVAIFFGVWTCLSISPLCIVAGIWQILAGFVVILIEAPFCCMFLDFVQQFSAMVEGRPIWQKAAVYLVAPREEMAAASGGSGNSGNIGSSIPTRQDSMRSGLVGNIHGQDVEAAKQGSF